MTTPTCPRCQHPLSLADPGPPPRWTCTPACEQAAALERLAGRPAVPVAGLGDLRAWRPAAALPGPVTPVPVAVWAQVMDDLINEGWSFACTRHIEGPPGTTSGAGYLVVAFASETKRIEVACMPGEQGAAVMACAEICRATPPGVKGTD